MLTFSDLIIRVAELAGSAHYTDNGQGKAAIPIDPHDLDKCKRVVNDAIRTFIADCPPKGWRWMKRLAQVTFDLRTPYSSTADSGSATTLVDASLSTVANAYVGWTLAITGGTGADQTATITAYDETSGTLTFAALATALDDTSEYTLSPSDSRIIDWDKARYYLPQYFNGTIDGPIRYAAGSYQSAHIDWADESYIRLRRSPVVNTGFPMFAAIVPHEPSSASLTATRRWELIVDPQPVREDTVEFPYTLQFEDMQLEAGTATSGTTEQLADANRTEPDEYFTGWVLRIIDGTGAGQTATVTSYASSTFAFDTIATAPDDTSVYVVEPAANLHPAGQQFDGAIRDAVLAETEKQFEDVLGNYVQYYRQVSLPQAQLLDARSAPRKLGPRGVVHERIWTNVNYNPRS